ANAVCRDEFDILGYGRLSFGSPVNWQFDAVSGQQTAPAHGSRTRYLANDLVGDSKVVWELNRHQWLLDLGQAWRFTGDARYAEAFVRQVSHWMKVNPPGFGMNWSSSLEVGMRMISWCWALNLFSGAAAFTPELFLQMLGWIQAHARYVERNLSRYFSPNTHLTGEALGLFYAGTLLPELDGAKRWKELGHEILVAELERQVLPGGVYFEQSTRYQYYTVEMYQHFLILAERNRVPVPARVRDCLRQMVEFLLLVRRPDGTVPQIGDTDGGWLLPLVRREPGDYRGLFTTAAVLLGNPRFAWTAGNSAYDAHGSDAGVETCWLLGSQALAGLSSPDVNPGPGLPWSPPVTATLSCFREGGYVVMRAGWGERAHQLIFDTGPLGCGVSGGHGHADLLSVQCSAWGENFLVDAGTFCYTADAAWRRFFRSSQAHSTVLLDGRGQADPDGPFSWHQRPSARLLNCASKPGFCLAEAEHDAWAYLEDPVIHRRRVLFVDSRYWLIIDDLSGRAEHRIDLRYQFAPMPVAAEEQGWVRALGESSALLVKAFSSVPLATTIARGQLEPPVGWFSPNYGQKFPAPALTFSAVAMLPLRVVTLLYPLAEPAGEAPAVAALIEAGSEGGRLAGVTVVTDERVTLFIEDHEVFVQNSMSTCVASREY
ncbi:MAG: alginate lyase family protein, partial [Lysobacterales bacterium]